MCSSLKETKKHQVMETYTADNWEENKRQRDDQPLS